MPSKLAVQMYTLRDFTKTAKDFAETLDKVSRIGYPAVQLSAVGCMGGDSPEINAAQGKIMLDDHGLKCVATHRDWDALAGNTQAEIEFHKTLDCDYAAIGGLPAEYRDGGEAGYRNFVRDAQPVRERLKAAGITFGYHNHAHEFFRFALGPKTAYDVFIEEGSELFTLELDTYWAVHAGADPISIIKRLPGRVPVVHFKDKEVVAEGPIMAAIGEGNLNWDGIIPACEAAGTNWYCIEQDTCPRDPFDCLRSSFEFLSAKGI